jgi:hypothetical protein
MLLYNEKEMWRERLKRIALVASVGVFLLLTGKILADRQVEIHPELITGKIEKIGEEVLGRAVEILPGASSSSLKEKTIESAPAATPASAGKTDKIMETQTKEIIEMIKRLPQDQFQQIKKQIFKDLCQELLRE